MHLRLEVLCVKAIASNFERHNLVFTSTEDLNLKRNYEFLQKKYSFDLIECVTAKMNLRDEYMDLLVNKYLKVIKTKWFRECSWEKITSKIAEIGCNVEKIVIMTYLEVSSKEYYKYPWEDIICHLPSLKRFTFRHNCNDLILTNVVELCPDIEEIDVKDSTITFDAVKCHDHRISLFLKKLKKLCIARTCIKPDVVIHLLKNLPSLEMIDYGALPNILYSMHRTDLFFQPYNIAALDLMSCANVPLSAEILNICLSVCPHLKSLTCGVANKEDLDLFSNLCALEKLHIKKFSRSEININDLLKSKGEKLTSLKIVNCTVSISVLAKNCPNLRDLNMSRIHFLFDDESKPVFNSLSSCTFESSNLSKSARAISLLLSSSEKLESLSFKRCNLASCEIKAHILKCCELYPIKEISFSRSVISKEYLKDLLSNCRTLRCLDIEGCFSSLNEEKILNFAAVLSNKPLIINSKHFFSSYEHSENSKCFSINDRDYDGYFEICERRGRREADEFDDDTFDSDN